MAVPSRSRRRWMCCSLPCSLRVPVCGRLHSGCVLLSCHSRQVFARHNEHPLPRAGLGGHGWVGILRACQDVALFLIHHGSLSIWVVTPDPVTCSLSFFFLLLLFLLLRIDRIFWQKHFQGSRFILARSSRLLSLVIGKAPEP